MSRADDPSFAVSTGMQALNLSARILGLVASGRLTEAQITRLGIVDTEEVERLVTEWTAMTDDLRTRIAAVLLAHGDESDAVPDCICGWEWHGENLWRKSYADHLADALIRELGWDDPLSAFRLRACADTMDAYWCISRRGIRRRHATGRSGFH